LDLSTDLQKEIEDRKEAINNIKYQIEETKQELENTIGKNKQELEEKLTNLSNELKGESSKLDGLTKRVTDNERTLKSMSLAIVDLYGEVGTLRDRAKSIGRTHRRVG